MKEIEYDGITYLYFDGNFVEKDSYIIPTDCDLEEYEKARQFCDIAYAEQGGGTGIKTELTLVYQRIKKEISPWHPWQKKKHEIYERWYRFNIGEKK